jgi:hypothetical protein
LKCYSSVPTYAALQMTRSQTMGSAGRGRERKVRASCRSAYADVSCTLSTNSLIIQTDESSLPLTQALAFLQTAPSSPSGAMSSGMPSRVRRARCGGNFICMARGTLMHAVSFLHTFSCKQLTEKIQSDPHNINVLCSHPQFQLRG